MASTTYEQKRFCEIKRCGKIDHFGNVTVMVRNAGQLPQPFLDRCCLWQRLV